MADYGFRARNGSNEIQIDSTYKNFALRDKGVITASEGWFHVNFRQANAYTARNTGVVAFRSNGAATLYGMSPSGSGMSLNFLGYQPEAPRSPSGGMCSTSPSRRQSRAGSDTE